MNKKLIALAVAAASVAPAAMAQTANPVTLYGRIYVMFESVEAKGGASPVVRRNRVSDQSSLLGVRGTEDLGGGLKAFFQLETAFRPDSNNTTFAARNSGVGLQGGFGSILMGRWDSPYKSATIAIDPFGDLTIGGITGINNDQGNHDRRAQNVVQYWSPNMAGFAVRASYSANENRTDATATTRALNPSEIAGSLTYGKGPIYAFLTYEKLEDQSAALNEQEATSVGGSFVVGPVKLGALYATYKKTGRTDKDSWMANAVYTIGKHQLIYQYQQAEDGGLSSATVQPEAKSHTVGYQYNFSRRTFFLAQYVKVDNKNGATGNFGSNTLTIAPDQDPQGIAVGLRHVF